MGADVVCEFWQDGVVVLKEGACRAAEFETVNVFDGRVLVLG